MRTSTILGISLCLSAGVVLGWVIGNSKPEALETPLPKLVAEAFHPKEIAEERVIPHVAEPSPTLDFDADRVRRLLQASRYREALSLLSDVSPDIDLSSAEGKQWARLLVDAYAGTNNTSQLLLIYRRVPSAVSSNERVNLMIAEALMAQQDIAEYRSLRKQWLGKETEKARWTFLDVQDRISIGKPAEAVELLLANQFEGKDETERLVRLAALFVINDPKRAWTYLSEAAHKDPSDPNVFTFRANLNEKLRQNEGAGADYIAAVRNDPENPYRREQLADFYIRNRQYVPALKVLQDSMAEPTLDTIWLKTLFWGRVVGPPKHTWGDAETPEGPLTELVVYLNRLPTGVFWNQKTFSKLPDAEHFLSTSQEAFWLRLLATLKSGDEVATKQLIEDHGFGHLSWQPELENGLKTLIVYRQAQPDPIETHLSLIKAPKEIDSPKELLSLLANLVDLPPEKVIAAVPPGLHDLLISEEAFVVPFLAAGWTEAAIHFHRKKDYPNTFPEWMAVDFTEALSENRSPSTALEFAQAQLYSPALSLLTAEIALSIDEKKIAFNALKGIYTSNDAHGQRAALLLGQFLMEHDNPQDAKRALLTHPSLSENETARELLARIAVQEGDMTKAYSLYQTLEKHSSEAKSFLARKAFAEKDWPRARQLTEALLEEFPDNSTLTDNLKKIAMEEKRRKPTP